jgi:5,6-dimethylbenzimidazole synthase
LKEKMQEEMFLSDSDRAGFYKTLYSRRDVRGQFKPDSIPDEVMARILNAAHHAPSVGFMQPWNFILLRSDAIKKKVHDCFLQANADAAKMFDEKKSQLYQSLKLEGILEAPINICITCDRSRSGPVVLGRTSMKSMDLYSSVCAVQNFWLAARAEGVGVGWVSIFDEEDLKALLNLPENVVPIAYLCVGYVSHFNKKPDLETAGWLEKQQLSDLVFFDQWENRQEDDPLIDEIKKQG